MSVPDIIAAVGTPLMGIVTDRYGKRTHFIIGSGICIFASLALMTFTTLPPASSMSLLGVAYSIFTSALWPCVPLLVERHQTATAYGLLSVALNITLTIVPIIVGALRSRYPSDWNYTLYFFLSLSLISILFSIMFFVIDHYKGGILCKSSYTTVDQTAISVSESEPLLNADELSDLSNDKGEYVAKVIAEGLVVTVPRVIIRHHHKIPYSSKESRHYHTTHCRCYEQQQLPGRRNVKLGKRRKSPVRRNFHSENYLIDDQNTSSVIVDIQNTSSEKDSQASIAASI
jgi:hypothetical protein